MDAQDNMKRREFVRTVTLVREFVIVDGIGRSGKGMIGHVLSSLERVEKQHNLDIMERIGIMWRNGSITRDAAVTLLRLEADTRLYNAFIGREINFRPSDDTGVFKNAYPLRYFKRLFAKAKDEGNKRCLAVNPIMQTCLHDGIRNAEIFFEAFGKGLKFIYIIRDPVYIIYEWQKVRAGQVIGNDSRNCHLTFDWHDKSVPYSVSGWEEEYLSITPEERVAALINHHFDLNITGYLAMDKEKKDRCLLVNFERFVSDPWPYCEEIADFLGTRTTRATKKILRREHCPRALSSKERIQKIQEVDKSLSPRYSKIFHDLLDKHESRYWEKIK